MVAANRVRKQRKPFKKYIHLDSKDIDNQQQKKMYAKSKMCGKAQC